MMLTRCPACATTFRVTPEQVKARHGQVRCGRCQHVFDAIEYLVESAPTLPVEPAEPSSAPVVATVQEEPITQANLSTPSEDSLAVVSDSATPPDADFTTEAAPTVTVPVTAAPREEDHEADPLDVPTSPGLDSVLLQPLPQLSPLSATYPQTRSARAARWPWMMGVVFALFALLLQIALAYRVELAARQPEIRPLLESLCTQFDCRVDLPSDPAQVAIEASDLHPAPQQKGKLELTATLRNRATHAQQWPHLEVTLTDAADKAVVRKIIKPLDFVPAGQNDASGFAANAELAIQLTLDAGDLPAAGYRLYLFYP